MERERLREGERGEREGERERREKNEVYNVSKIY